MAATVRASNEGLELVEKARNRKGWNKTEQAWADIATTSKATLRRFWGGLAIQTATFQAIGEAVGIEDWESIADFDTQDDAPPKTYEKRLSFAIAGSIEEIDKQKLDAIVALLRKLGGDAEIEILDIEEGSVKLTLGGSEESLQRLQELFDAGELQETEGLVIQDVHVLTKEEIIASIRNKTNYGQHLRGVNLRGANLIRANLIRAYLRDADLCGTDLRGAYLRDADLRDADLRDADLRGANLNGTDLRGTDLRGTDLRGAYLRGANLREAYLSEAYLRGANLNGANLNGANLNGADLVRANLIRANLIRAYLSEAYLSEAYLSEAYLSRADLRKANLRGANLNGTDLSRANLHEADLSEANLYKALVKMAQFINTQGISFEERTLLIQRGAIFEDGPNSPGHARAFA